MKNKFHFILFLGTVATAFLTCSTFASPTDVIIGSVNGDDLYLNEFRRLYNAQKNRSQNTDTKEFEETTKNKVLDKMINELLVLQEATARDIKTPEEEITKKINLIKEKQGGEEAFKKFLNENTATIEDAQNEVKNQILFELVKNEIIKENNDFISFINNKKSVATIIIYNDEINVQDENKDKQVAQAQPAPEELNKPLSDTALRANPYPTITKSKVEEIKKLEEKTNQIVQEQEKLQQAIDVASITEPTIIRPLPPENKNQEEIVKVINAPVTKFNKEKFKAWKEKVLKNKFKIARAEKSKIREQETQPQQPTAQVAPPPPQEPQNLNQPKAESQYSARLNDLNIFKRGNVNLQSIQSTNDISKELEDLRNKIEQRRVAPKQ